MYGIEKPKTEDEKRHLVNLVKKRRIRQKIAKASRKNNRNK